ncbi:MULTISPECIES: hypothetical protein [Mucilaginibacter]|uniref:hypothetical protein n=1 Tax=Mucilaginibacter TaxID=423349 RepID=UPI00159E3271|nr:MULTISPECIES: hypothetical protein [Mucilaginibacter]NVM61770.1 hypothetical protein [Mucilaginibacter sp. SG538B]GGB29963.1 hypothetical protein GCM10011500_52920 [Mucilaginibacter rubeus]
MKVKHLAICLAISSFTLHLSATANAKSGGAYHKPAKAAPAVEGWYFRAVSGYPAAIAFEPVVLFKNGEYFDVGDEPIETLDVTAAKSSRPKAWGTWKKTGATFYLTNNEGKTYDYKLGEGNWFPAYPYTGSIKLKKGYEKVSGGDYGNGTNALVIKKINFIDDTHFTEGSNGGIMTPAASAWKKTGGKGGTYKIYGNTIELNYGSKVIKKSFALGASGSPAHATNTMIFIGGDAYTDTE